MLFNLQTIETAFICKTAVDTNYIFTTVILWHKSYTPQSSNMETCGENVTTISRGEHKNSTLSKWRVSNYGRAHNWAICILRAAPAGRQKPQYVSGLPTRARYFYYWHFGSLNAVYWKPEKMFRKLQKIRSHSAFFLIYWGLRLRKCVPRTCS